MLFVDSHTMTRRTFHIVLALPLLACVLCPYVETVIHWNQTVFDTGYDGESTVAVIALKREFGAESRLIGTR